MKNLRNWPMVLNAKTTVHSSMLENGRNHTKVRWGISQGTFQYQKVVAAELNHGDPIVGAVKKVL